MATSVLLFLVSAFVALDRHLSTASYLLNEIPPCEYKEFPCDSGQCIERTSWCDGPSDCFDESDEKYCRTFDPAFGMLSSNLNDCDYDRYFQCQNGMCIPRAGRCNDMPDCQEGEDEENCDYLYDTSETAGTTTSNLSTTSTPLPTIQSSATTTTSTTTTTTTPVPPSSTKPVIRGDIPSWLPTRQDVLHKSLRQVMEGRDSTWGWGRATPRIASALYLANDSYFDSHDGQLTSKQLEVQLALDLMRNHEKPLRMLDLAHYVNALLATCIDPHDFHGINVLRMLKRSMSKRLSKGLFVSPLAYLTLCNAGDTFPESYLRRLKNMAYRRNDEPRWLDVQTYALLAISCRASRQSDQDEEWHVLKKDVARNVSDLQQQDGGFGSMHSTALALQALIAAAEPGTETVKGRAMTHLLLSQDWQGSYGNEHDTYYVLPALNLNSLASLHNRNCRRQLQTHPSPAYDIQGIEGVRLQSVSSAAVDGGNGKRKQPTQLVHYSLWLGGGLIEIQTITLTVPKHSHFLSVMEAAQKINPHFKHEVLTTGRSTSIHSIAGRASDVDTSTYWTLYRRVPLPFRPKLTNVTATVARLKLLGAKRWTKDIRKLHPRDGEHLAFWYKPYL